MQHDEIDIQRWSGDKAPDEAELRNILAAESLDSYRWSNRPGDVYGAHSHSFHKVIYVVQGSITFGIMIHVKNPLLRTGRSLKKQSFKMIKIS